MILALAVGLALDAFAVAIGVGLVLPRLTLRPVFRLAWHFGFFQFFMPIVGWVLGMAVHEWIAVYDHWVAFAVLVVLGGKMVVEGWRGRPSELRTDPTRGWSLVLLSIGTSIDALAVGLTMGVLRTKLWVPAAIIGVVACVMTILGLYVGDRLGKMLGRRVEVIGGVVLIAIGVKILFEHLR